MSQEISPKVIAIVVAVLVVIVAFFAWRTFSRPGKANITFGFTGSSMDKRKNLVTQTEQAQSASGTTATPANTGGP